MNPSVADFFRTTVRDILQNRKLRIHETTEFYIVNLLTEALQSSSENADPNYFDEPLAILFGKACNTKSKREKCLLLKHLGDQSLYVSGFFGDSLQNKLVDIDYYVSMGSNAYGELSNIGKNEQQSLFPEVFDEMAVKFTIFVDLFSEISERGNMTNNQDILRMYERWLYTKSKRLLEKLQGKGIYPQDEDPGLH